MEDLHKLFNDSELILQQFERSIYELFEKDQWPKHAEIKEYFKLPDPLYLFNSNSDINERITDELESMMKRRKMCEIFSFSIPSFEALQVIKEFQPIVEIGAGSGFWAALLKKIDCDIIATTIDNECHPFPKKFTEIKFPCANAITFQSYMSLILKELDYRKPNGFNGQEAFNAFIRHNGDTKWFMDKYHDFSRIKYHDKKI